MHIKINSREKLKREFCKRKLEIKTEKMMKFSIGIYSKAPNIFIGICEIFFYLNLDSYGIMNKNINDMILLSIK